MHGRTSDQPLTNFGNVERLFWSFDPDLINERIWAVWGPVGDGAPDKCPRGRAVRPIRHKNPDERLTFYEAVEIAKAHGLGIGVVLTENETRWSVIDLDSALGGNGEPQYEAARVVLDRYRNHFVERSTSGRGLHVFVRGVPSGLSRNRFRPADRDTKIGEHGEVEIYYKSHRFIALTGDLVGTGEDGFAPTEIFDDIRPHIALGNQNAPVNRMLDVNPGNNGSALDLRQRSEWLSRMHKWAERDPKLHTLIFDPESALDEYNGDPSSAAFALTCKLARKCGPGNAHVVDYLFRQTEMYHFWTEHNSDVPKWDRLCQSEIARAYEFVTTEQETTRQSRRGRPSIETKLESVCRSLGIPAEAQAIVRHAACLVAPILRGKVVIVPNTEHGKEMLVWRGDHWSGEKSPATDHRQYLSVIYHYFYDDIRDGLSEDEYRLVSTVLNTDTYARQFFYDLERLPGMVVTLPEIVERSMCAVFFKNGVITRDEIERVARSGGTVHDVQLQQHDPTKWFNTWVLPVDWNPDAPSDVIEKYFCDWLAPDVVEYLFRIIGDVAFGGVPELVIWLGGRGETGKTTFGNALQWMFGRSLAYTANPSVLQARKPSGHNESLARLSGKRFAIVSEPHTGKHGEMTSAVLKQLSSDDMITASFKSRPEFTFRRTFVFFVLSNRKPDLEEGVCDSGLKRRFVHIPFERLNVDERTRKTLAQIERDFRSQHAGFMKLVVAGAIRAITKSVLSVKPETVVRATEAMEMEMSDYNGWVESWLRQADADEQLRHFIVGHAVRESMVEYMTAKFYRVRNTETGPVIDGELKKANRKMHDVYDYLKSVAKHGRCTGSICSQFMQEIFVPALNANYKRAGIAPPYRWDMIDESSVEPDLLADIRLAVFLFECAVFGMTGELLDTILRNFGLKTIVDTPGYDVGFGMSRHRHASQTLIDRRAALAYELDKTPLLRIGCEKSGSPPVAGMSGQAVSLLYWMLETNRAPNAARAKKIHGENIRVALGTLFRVHLPVKLTASPVNCKPVDETGELKTSRNTSAFPGVVPTDDAVYELYKKFSDLSWKID